MRYDCYEDDDFVLRSLLRHYSAMCVYFNDMKRCSFKVFNFYVERVPRLFFDVHRIRLFNRFLAALRQHDQIVEFKMICYERASSRFYPSLLELIREKFPRLRALDILLILCKFDSNHVAVADSGA